MRARVTLALAAALACVATTANAERRDTQWLSDPRVEPKDRVETALRYELQITDTKALDAGIDLFTLQLTSGLGSKLEVRPFVRWRQSGEDPALLDRIGGTLRYQLVEEEDWQLTLWAGHAAWLVDEHDQMPYQGAVARYELDRIKLSGQLSLTEGFGGARDDRVELLAGVYGGYAVLPDEQLRLGAEGFVLQPLAGERISDPVFGTTGDSANLYVGPSIALHLSSFWAGVSAVTGMLSDNGSQAMLRFTMAVRR